MLHVISPRVLLVAGAGVIAVVVLVVVLTVLTRVTPSTGLTPVPAASSAQATPANAVCFVSNDQAACVNRISIQAAGTLTDQVRAQVQSLVSGPTSDERAAGVRSALPDGATLSDLSVTDRDVVIDLVLPDAFLSSLTASQVEDANQQFLTTLLPFDLLRIDVMARDSTGAFKPLSSFLPPVVQPHKENSAPLPTTSASSAGSGQPPITGQPQGHGALSGKTVFVSAGHGWYWYSAGSYYNTQRPVYPTTPYPPGQGIIEDFNNAEVVDQYLLPYLWNSGADAWTVRERDMNTDMLIVDDSSGGFSTQGSWSTGTGGYANSYHAAATSASATATAMWTFVPPTTGTYAVYVWFPAPASITRTVDVHYSIDHAGGTTPLTITQARDNSNWRFVGSYPFLGGQAASVRLSNQSSTPGLTVLADAIRIGGGVGDVSVQGAPSSGKPRWEEQAMQYARWVGVPNVDSLNDVIVRPIYSEWERDPSEDAVYISWHTNGYNGYNTTARGTTSYIHSFQPTPDSDVLQSYLHTELLNDIHLGWDSGWPDQGKQSADLGELRLLSTMPGVLLENGFHDNPIDVTSMKDPRFNQLSARAVYHGLVRYWNHMDPAHVPLVFLPEPPTHLAVRNSGAGQVTLTWQPGPTDGQKVLGDAATSYRVYISSDGIGWRDGISVAQTTCILTGLATNQLIYVRVTGVNTGGESFPTPVLAARVAATGIAPILIVAGFDRLDQSMTIPQYDAPVGIDMRLFLNRMNRYDYIIQHAGAITPPFDSVQHAVVSDGQIGLSSYTVVDWLAGQEETPDVALNANDQAQLTGFLNGGGGLFLSGAEIGLDLVTNGQGASFYTNQLHASFVLDNGDVNHAYLVNAPSGSIFNGLGSIAFDDSTHGGTYNVNAPDSFNPLSGASTALVYNTGGPAAIQYRGGTCGGLVYLGVPFETIYSNAIRNSMMSQIVSYLGRCLASSLNASRVSLPLIAKNYVAPIPPVTSTCSNLIVNGSFEAGDLSGWTTPTSWPSPGTVLTNTLGGSYAARVGAIDTANTLTGDSSIQQAVMIPAGTLTATLSFVRYPYSGNTTQDFQYAAVLTTTQVPRYLVYDQSLVANARLWLPARFDLTAFAGQTIQLRFSARNSAPNDGTGMFVDEVVLQVCTP